MLSRWLGLVMALLVILPAQADTGKPHALRDLTLGMSREEATKILSDYRLFCEPQIIDGYQRHHGTICKYREYHFGIFFTLRPDNDQIYRIEIEDKYPDGFDLEAVDNDLIAAFGKPDISKRNAMVSGSYLRVWNPDLTVRLEDYEQDTIRMVLLDPSIDDAQLHDWYVKFAGK